MRKIIKEYEAYTFDELEKDIQEKLIKEHGEYMRDAWNETFCANTEELMQELFPNSTVNFQYSLSDGQGDGLNICGSLDCSDILNKLDYNNEEKENLENLLHKMDVVYFSLEANIHYTYCTTREGLFYDEIEYQASYLDEDMENLFKDNKDLFKEFDNKAVKYIQDLCSELKTDGYDFIYRSFEEVKEDYMEHLECSGLMFLKNGETFEV